MTPWLLHSHGSRCRGLVLLLCEQFSVFLGDHALFFDLAMATQFVFNRVQLFTCGRYVQLFIFTS